MNTPVTLFVYNRLEHTRRTVDALKDNYLAQDSELFIFSDAPKSDVSFKEVAPVREYIKTIDGFKNITVVEREKNLGLSQSIITGVTELVNQYGKIIVLEDDMLTSPYFLQFMNESLEFYEDISQVACVHGYMYPISEKLPETFFLRMADCWGWGTWKRGWDLFEPDGRKLLNELEERNLQRDFDLNYSHNYIQMLKEQIVGQNDSWAIRWYASVFLKGKLGFYPGRSLVHNIGLDETGTHCGKNNCLATAVTQKLISIERIPVKENKSARKQLEKFYTRNKPGFLSRFAKTFSQNSIPALVVKTYNRVKAKMPCKKKYGYFGNSSTWDEALAECDGYESEVILEKVKTALLKVKNGEAVYERDSVLFDKIQYSRPVLSGLLRIASKNGNSLSLLDFGGSLGSSFFQNKNALAELNCLRWSVVEQAHFVACGKKHFQSEELKFYEDFHSCISQEQPNVLLISSVLQYLERPYDMLQTFVESGIQCIIVDRTPFFLNGEDRLTVQKVHPSIYKASYPAWFFNKQKFLQYFTGRYNLISEFDALAGRITIYPDKAIAIDKGYIFEISKAVYDTDNDGGIFNEKS